MDDRFIYNSDVEVMLTGRTAEKQVRGDIRSKATTTDTLVEITPVDVETHGNWTTFVRFLDLYKISGIAG